MNRKVINKLIGIAIISVALTINMPIDAFASTAVVQKVNTNLQNGAVSSNTVTSGIKLYYGTNISVSNVNELKNQIESCLTNQNTSVSLKYTGRDITDWKATINKCINDVLENPKNDYARYTMSSYNYSYNTIGDITIKFTYIETKEQSKVVDTKVKEIIKSIIKPGMTDEQKEKAINNYIVTHVAYDTSLAHHSAYAALVAPNKTVCQGYALLAYKMLKEAGFQVRIISGTANGNTHAWNLVKINGAWYHLDTTWNDPVPDVQGRIRYDYFNLEDAQISDSVRKHSWDKSKYVGYECVTPYTTNDLDILKSSRMNESKAPSLNNITITNNKGTSDKINVSGLNAGDTVKVFSDGSVTAKVLGQAVVTNGAKEVNVNISQLGANGGKVYLSVINKGKIESARIGKAFNAEAIK
ncbi:Transglutaminase-like superfamily protein [Clostridium cavendishii DSM 21758]|uniref:Transglutaminase-like superfamily protein n=1 Tax=Clostridium cavendishii DSM 21758 TaxID=1121302 RepID=A0A1M6GBS9_9CLOT|nr:transglutaminase domain-containing protein [Clostridium cavendishii]SHJ07349.1 Transglutaminase-like superfamily protein [Clostridium cavendishii DSM 21758]